MYSEELQELFKRKRIGIGDSISVKAEGMEVTGDLMPSTDFGDANTLVIKLGNGYNIGIKLSKKAGIEKLPTKKETFTFPKATLKENRNLPKVTIVTIGGTIGSKVDYATGGVIALTKPEELFYLIPELSDIADIKINGLMSIMSEDVTYKEWQRMATETANALNEGSRGVVLTHGTDTMSYTSAALSFMLKDLNAPVAITGSQRSSDRGSSDAFMNLVCAIRMAAYSDVAEVGICMHATSSDTFCNFMRGTKVRKMHTSRRDAFRPINCRPIARTAMSGGNIEYLNSYKKVEGESKKIKPLIGFEPKVALVKFYPHSDPEIIEYYKGKGYKGIIIEGTGLGHVAVAPSVSSYGWLGHMKNAVDSGMIIGVASQCLNGRVNTSVYTNLRLASRTGAIYCEDMLPETALVKLGWLLGNYGKEKAAELLDKNLVGEISTRVAYDTFLI
jgi:glutamyl-tRNA(Gln) amidotransferase subunit D